MIPAVSYKHKYVYYFNLKSACSTYRRMFLELHQDELIQSVDIDVDFHKVVDLFAPQENYEHFYKFSIVRNPYTRLVSAYLNKCANVNNSMDFIERIQEPICKFLKQDYDVNTGYTFHELLLYLEQNIDNCDTHFQKQWEPHIELDNYYRIEDDLDNLKAIYVQIFFDNQEKLQQALNLIDKYGRRLENQTVSGERALPTNIDLAHLYFDEIRKINEKFDISYQNFYNAKTKKLIGKIYEQELRAYNYSFPW